MKIYKAVKTYDTPSREELLSGKVLICKCESTFTPNKADIQYLETDYSYVVCPVCGEHILLPPTVSKRFE